MINGMGKGTGEKVSTGGEVLPPRLEAFTNPGLTPNPILLGRKVADRGVLFHEIPCHHNTLLKGPHAARAAELLKQHFDRTDKQVSMGFTR